MEKKDLAYFRRLLENELNLLIEKAGQTGYQLLYFLQKPPGGF